MRQLVATLVLCCSAAFLAIPAQAQNGPTIQTPSDTVDLGEIFIDELNVNHGKLQIKVSNSGNQPLLLQKVSGCCGTNIKQWTKAPILPNKEGSIDVEFRIEPSRR